MPLRGLILIDVHPKEGQPSLIKTCVIVNNLASISDCGSYCVLTGIDGRSWEVHDTYDEILRQFPGHIP